MEDKQKMKVIAAVAIAVAVVFGVLLIAYSICKRKNFRGNITFFDQLWKKYQGRVEKLRWLFIAFEQVKHVTCPGLSLVVKVQKNTRKFGIPTIFFYFKIWDIKIFFVFFFFFSKSNVDKPFF